MPKGKAKLFTDENQKAVLRDLYEQSVVGQRQKELDKYYAFEEIYDDCRYCGEISEFFLHTEGSSERIINGRKYILSHCQHCNGVNWILFKVRQSGDPLHGFVYEPDVVIRKEEDVIRGPLGQDTPSPVPEKPQNFSNVIQVKIK